MTAFSERPFTGRKFLFFISAFFALVFLADGIMMWKAISTFDGLEGRNSYEEGRQYNKVLAAARQQARLGWQADTVLDPLPGQAGYLLSLRLKDKDGRPLDGLKATARFRRTVTANQDRTAALAPMGGGLYRAAIPLPGYGRWQLRLSAETGNATVWEEDRLISRFPK